MRDSMQDDTSARMTLNIGLRTNGTVNGTAVSMAGTGNSFRTAMLLAISGAVTDGTHTVSLEESDTGTSGWTAVGAGDLQGTLTPITTTNANSVQRQSYTGGKAWLRAVVVTTGATTGGTTAGVILLHQGSGAPVT
jgi:hypothetical protein